MQANVGTVDRIVRIVIGLTDLDWSGRDRTHWGLGLDWRRATADSNRARLPGLQHSRCEDVRRAKV